MMGIRIVAYRCMVLDRVFASADEAEKTAEKLNKGFPDTIFLPFSESNESDLSHYATIRGFVLQESKYRDEAAPAEQKSAPGAGG